jgi:hypothetical protein
LTAAPRTICEASGIWNWVLDQRAISDLLVLTDFATRMGKAEVSANADAKIDLNSETPGASSLQVAEPACVWHALFAFRSSGCVDSGAL